MAKKQTRSTAKTAAKPKAALRKVTVRDLGPRKADEVKGGSYSIRQRCF